MREGGAKGASGGEGGRVGGRERRKGVRERVERGGREGREGVEGIRGGKAGSGGERRGEDRKTILASTKPLLLHSSSHKFQMHLQDFNMTPELCVCVCINTLRKPLPYNHGSPHAEAWLLNKGH